MKELKISSSLKLEDLHDPELMLNMKKAVNRIHKAIIDQERVMVYGDYDVDGTTSVAMVASFLEALDVQIVPYIPEVSRRLWSV